MIMQVQDEIDLHRSCPKYERAVQILGKRWTPVIRRARLGGARRFSEIAAYTSPISDRLLSRRLKELEMEGIVERRIYPETPVLIEYTLTPEGAGLQEVVEAIQRWADRFAEDE